MKSVAGAPLMWIRPFSDIFQFISGVMIMIRINFAFRKIRINPPKTVRIKFSDLGVSSPGSLRGSSGVSSLVSAAHLLGSCQNWGNFRVKMLPWDESFGISRKDHPAFKDSLSASLVSFQFICFQLCHMSQKASLHFCQECNNLLYPKADAQRRIIVYACRICQYSEIVENQLVYRNDLLTVTKCASVPV